MTYRRGREPSSFVEAIALEKDRICRDYDSKLHYSYVDRGFYYRQVVRFLEYTDKSNMLFLLTEDLRERPIESLRACFEFLEVGTDYLPENVDKAFHVATVPWSMTLLNRIVGDSFEKKIARLLIPWQKPRRALGKKLLELNQTVKHTATLDDETRLTLAKMYIQENEQLGELIGRDLGHWDRVPPGLGNDHVLG
jgi:hypothetical protein